MIELKNVSKFYYNNGIISKGFSKVNLKFNTGEFVIITGESGSGKSTLLNVISGLDSYEEGEMLINESETSHYSEKDLEIYRKKYIANIFQNFNLINSYTVYQNIELAYLINGYTKKESREKVLNLIKKINLIKFKNSKVSKLSGGQKQKVAIARALAKNSSIIVADEPTANLDKKSAESVIKLLHDISSEKLVIVVTHNYEQFKKYATRKIKMHDGRILEDKCFKEIKNETKENINNNISLLNKLKIGIRNVYNVLPKFLLLFFIYFFIICAISSEYTSLQKQKYETNLIGINNYFENYSNDRIIIKKENKKPFKNQDYQAIKKISNVDYIVKDDILLDTSINLESDNISLFGYPYNSNNDEIYIKANGYDYPLNKELLNKEYIINFNNEKIKVILTSYEYSNDEHNRIYLSNSVLQKLRAFTNADKSNLKLEINDKIYKNLYTLKINSKVKEGEVYISDSFNYYCPKYACKNNKIKVTVDNIYYGDSKELLITNLFNKNNFKSLLDLDYSDEVSNNIYINENDYYRLYDHGYYQSSIYLKNPIKAKETLKELNDLNIQTLFLPDALAKDDGVNQVISILRVSLISVLTIGLFFISYFLITLILKSRNSYFATLRVLGCSSKDCKQILSVELITILNVAYMAFLMLIILVSNNILDINYIKDLIIYLKTKDYIYIYLVLILMSYLISIKFSNKIFKSSTMNVYREKV